MTRHIEFCLEEIQCEIEALDLVRLSIVERTALQSHVAGMRAILAVMAAAPQGSLVAGLAEETDDLTLIRGIDDTDAAMLAIKGVHDFATIAGWRRKDIDELGSELARRIAQENWIEQAAILSGGGKTDFASKRASAAAVPTVEAAPIAAGAATSDVATEVKAVANAGDASVEQLQGRRLGTGLRRIAATLLLIAGFGALNTSGFFGREGLGLGGHMAGFSVSGLLMLTSTTTAALE